MRGPTAQLALDGYVVTEYLDSKTTIKQAGKPARQRKHLNGYVLDISDSRIIRRWSTGKTVTKAAFERLLDRYGLTLRSYKSWAKKNDVAPTLRGQL